MATVEPLTPGTMTASPMKKPSTPLLATSLPFLYRRSGSDGCSPPSPGCPDGCEDPAACASSPSVSFGEGETGSSCAGSSASAEASLSARLSSFALFLVANNTISVTPNATQAAASAMTAISCPVGIEEARIMNKLKASIALNSSPYGVLR